MFHDEELSRQQVLDESEQMAVCLLIESVQYALEELGDLVKEQRPALKKLRGVG